MGVPRSAWAIGAKWKAISGARGTLVAEIIGKGTKPGHKLITMRYLDGVGARYGDVTQEYSHKHMVKYFIPQE